ncbi:maleylpyruvate isomerase family mycothiol-dependent enzyme [Nocardia sp. CDC159]|uniref:Maleylpyruvate isomerase family mycothiol-dependent enzyme n=1 Tax=Nocardia pulmonis TaxID=2951408 RepID=A0A9X2EF22_9NOCA|nr:MULTISPECIES: maleylpyruvate isomerase family mycothiol-dependent enzyme [Nocardia]MCM6777813.1 maleylpyruvate isomerase family mycothiol-dependent enzyme [Nocardia pulmonis]MCM6790697.1 maleylpyruvate isomerase family mycothiol-dependent enzyme [Nocardia sp. CDC159]
MTETPDRAEITAALSEQWDALAQLVAGLDESRWRTSSPLPGWTVFDVLAHVVGTESMLLGEPLPRVDTDPRALAHVRNETGALNETWLESLRPLPGARLLERFIEVTGRRRAALAAIDDDAWHAEIQSPIGLVSYGRFMRVRLFDCWMHELDIADALAIRVDEGGRRAEAAVDEIEPFLGRTLVKRGQAPDGSRITLELTGPVSRTLHVRVDGRAELVATPDRPADVVIRLDSGLFARLCGGRTTAGEQAERIELSGDRELGQRLVDNLAFTI